jgi:hypothetical protein
MKQRQKIDCEILTRNKQLHNVYDSLNIIRVVKIDCEIGGSCSTCGRGEKCIQNLGGNSKGNRPLGRPELRWENNIAMGLREIVLEVVD